MKFRILGYLCFFVTLPACSQSNAVPPIANWNSNESNGIYHFFPSSKGDKIDYYLMPAIKGIATENLGDWVKQQGLNDIKEALWTEVKSGVSKNQPEMSYYITTVSDKSGRELIAMYAAYVRKDRAVRFAKFYYPADTYDKSQINIAAGHFGSMARKETQSGDGGAGTGNVPVVTSGNSLASTGIKGVVMHSESSTGVGGIVGYVVRPYLFYTNGSFYGWLDTDPYNINIDASRRDNPKKWGTWHKSGQSIFIRWDSDGRTEEWTASSWAEPAAKGEKIAGSFSSISGSGNTAYGGGSIAMSSKYITFSRDGRFTFESVGGGGYSGGGDGTTVWSSRNTAGTYILDGYSIELRFNNGKVIRNSFSFYDNKKDMFSFGSSIYIKGN